MEWVTILNYLT